jgi:hypothetical protein
MFQLTKIWVDPNPNVDSVEIRYTWSALGSPPKWGGNEESEVMMVVPNTNPRIRQATLEIPRYLDGKDNYLLHYQFGGGGEHHEGFSRIFTEEIVAREIPYVDTEGLVTEVRLLWSVGRGWTAPNWTQSKLEGLSLNVGKDTPGHDAEGEGIADEAIYELVQTVPLPRRFLAKVWGPRGETVQYSFQLIRSNTPLPEDEFERWDDNQSRHYIVSLA